MVCIKTKTAVLLVAIVITCAVAKQAVAADPACTQACPSAAMPTDCVAVSPSSAVDPNADITVSSCMSFSSGTYIYHHVNVVAGGILWFVDDGGEVDLKVNSLLVEQGGRVVAGQWCKPFGCAGGRLNVWLWGDDPTNQGAINAANQGIQCKSPGGCYPALAQANKYCCTGADATSPCAGPTSCATSGQNSAFEGYGALPVDGDNNFFGFKVFAVSYGGSVEMFGRKGVAPSYFVRPDNRSAECETPADQYASESWAQLTGHSWVRLGATARAGATTITLDRAVSWNKGDQIVISTTDWHPSHSEVVEIAVDATLSATVEIIAPLAYDHFGDLTEVDDKLAEQAHNPNKDVDTRAAVGLLTRSITIRSLGATPDAPFPAASACAVGATDPLCYFGGHTIVRQGFAKYQIQGVEFHQLGQGGRIGHYPAHFHLAKDSSYTNAIVTDSSSWDSMTRFFVIHGTHEVAVERNVGFLSIGHGYYLEDASEINNRVCHNLAVSLRAPLMTYLRAQPAGSRTSRMIPGILASVTSLGPAIIQGGDDYAPTAFWTMNMFNDIVGNMAAGVHGFGSCFWLLGSELSGPSKYLLWASKTSTSKDYAQWHRVPGRLSPIKRFRGNSCSTAFSALQSAIDVFPTSTGDTGFNNGNRDSVPHPTNYTVTYDMLPRVTQNFQPTRFSDDPIYQINDAVTCVKSSLYRSPPFDGSDDHYRNPLLCSGAVVSRFRTSFNFQEQNFGSVWLRGYWFLFIDSAITDQLFGGLGFVTGGSWLDAPPGFWMLTSNSVFIGRTQTDSVYANFTGPAVDEDLCFGNTCTIPVDGTAIIPAGLNFGRSITIYDGPFFSDGSVFMRSPNFTCDASLGSKECGAYRMTNQPQEISRGANSSHMMVTNAAIGWKQPNGFYYPPAFAFRRSAFDNETNRHTVIDITQPYLISGPGSAPKPAGRSLFDSVRSIDASTILIDEDGTLTGVINPNNIRTSSLSSNTFFNSPPQVPECKSFGVQTTPFEMLTTVISAAKQSTQLPSAWRTDLAWAFIDPNLPNPTDPSNLYSTYPFVPIYRQRLLPDDTLCEANICDGLDSKNGMFSCSHASMMAGSQTWSAPYLTMDDMTYYIDTNQQPLDGPVCSRFTGNFREEKLFNENESYVLYQLYPQQTSSVTYQLYVGSNFDVSTMGFFARIFPTQYLDTNNKQQAIVKAPQYPGTATVTDGVLTVTLNNSLIAADFEFEANEHFTQCLPRDVCEPNADRSGCVVSRNVTDPQLRESLKEVCEYWVTRAGGVTEQAGHTVADCPRNGCLAFVFTLPPGFAPRPYAEVGLPLALDFTCEEPWNTPLVRANTTTFNDCQATPSGYCAISYIDADGDGYGDGRFPKRAFAVPEGYVTNAADCNDADATVHPHAVENCGNAKDDNCNGIIDDPSVCAVFELPGNTPTRGRTQSQGSSASLSAGAIAGIVVGSVAAVALIAGVAMFTLKGTQATTQTLSV